MTYVTGRPSGTWEVRESHSTAAGPRSRTLATFRTLTPDVISQACDRSSKPLTPAELRKAARRAGAPVAGEDADRAAGELLAEIAAGREPRPLLRALLLDTLAPHSSQISHSARAAGRWASATPQQRGETLRDLLLLVDHLPSSRRGPQVRFPHLRSQPA